MDTFEKRVLNFVQRKKLIPQQSKVLIALSGGADSVFLFYFLLKIRRMFNAAVGVAHLNHMLRGAESDRDELFCRQLAEENEIPFYSAHIDIQKSAAELQTGVEEAARIERYAFFSRLMKEYDYTLTATGHHIDDNAETVLLNLFKGAGFHGMSGIPAQREEYIRPLLCLKRNDIHASLRNRKLTWREDSTNAENDVERNYIRNIIIPSAESKFGGSLADSIFRFSGLMNEVREFADSYTAETWSGVTAGADEERIYKTDKYYYLTGFLRKYALHELLKKELGGSGHGLTEDIFEKLESKAAFTYQTGKEARIYIGRGEIRFYRQQKNLNEFESIPVNSAVLYEGRRVRIEESEISEVDYSNTPDIEYIGTTEPLGSVTLRRWQAGDKFTPLGMKGTRLISDFLNDYKLPEHLKVRELVLLNGEEIIAVAGRRLSEQVKITEDKKFIYKVTVE